MQSSVDAKSGKPADLDDIDASDEEDEPPEKQHKKLKHILVDPHPGKNGVKILKYGGLFNRLMGQHYLDLLTALLSAPATQGECTQNIMFGLFVVDHRCFMTSVQALCGDTPIKPSQVAHLARDFGPIARQESGIKFLYKCTPFYLNFFCQAHREALFSYLMYIIFIKIKEHFVY